MDEPMTCAKTIVITYYIHRIIVCLGKKVLLKTFILKFSLVREIEA